LAEFLQYAVLGDVVKPEQYYFWQWHESVDMVLILNKKQCIKCAICKSTVTYPALRKWEGKQLVSILAVIVILSPWLWMVPLAQATSSYVNTITQQSTGFQDGTIV
jgi:hypothetical protein